MHVDRWRLEWCSGVIVGMLPIPLGGDRTVRLGLAGGTLLVALVLGRLERTGGISWVMPHAREPDAAANRAPAVPRGNGDTGRLLIR